MGLKETVLLLIEEIQELYKADEIPWIVGYSGGKDSTAVLCLVWMAVERLPVEERHKEIHVISTDTLVENPIVANWVTHSLKAMTQSAIDKKLFDGRALLFATVRVGVSFNRLAPGELTFV